MGTMNLRALGAPRLAGRRGGAAALACLLLLPGGAAALAGEPVAFRGRVVGVSDGDTLTVLRDGRPEKVRVAEIDAPEKAQAFGQRAKAEASALSFGKVVEVRGVTRDRYGRLVAHVTLPDGRSLGEAMIAGGLAWRYVRYSTSARLGELEAGARAGRRGLWADEKPMPPWEFRADGRGATQPAPERAPRAAPAIDAPVLGNARSKVFHLGGCAGYASMSAAHRRPFGSQAEAVAAGFRPHSDCAGTRR